MTEVRVPTLGESVTEATVATWFKKPGDAVAVDEMLCELETDKVTVEVPSPVAGTLGDIVAAEGDTVGVDALLANITEGAGAAAPAAAAAAAPAEASAPADAPSGGTNVDVMVPTLGESVTEATVASWIKKVGDTVSISMTGPDGHENEAIKGQPVTVQMAITHVHRLAPASIEDLLPQFGMQTEDELKERVKTMLEQRNEQTQQADMHKQGTEQIVDAVELDLPEGLKGRQIERALQRQQMELLYSGKQPEEIEEELAARKTGMLADAVFQKGLALLANDSLHPLIHVVASKLRALTQRRDKLRFQHNLPPVHDEHPFFERSLQNCGWINRENRSVYHRPERSICTERSAHNNARSRKYVGRAER